MSIHLALPDIITLILVTEGYKRLKFSLFDFLQMRWSSKIYIFSSPEYYNPEFGNRWIIFC
jgi:hypothetical protein